MDYDFNEGQQELEDIPEAQEPFEPGSTTQAVQDESTSGRQRRSEISRRLPRRYMQLKEHIPRAKPRNEKLEEMNREKAETTAFAEATQAAEVTRCLLRTKTSRAGLTCIYAEYMRKGANGGNEQDRDALTELSTEPSQVNLYHPFPNKSSFEWTKILWLGQHQLSWPKFEEMTNIIKQPDFNSTDINLYEIKRICRTVTKSMTNWTTIDLKIKISTGHLSARAPAITEYTVDKFKYRPLMTIAADYLKSPAANRMSFDPMELRYQPPYGNSSVGVYGELTWSKEFRKKHAEIQSLPHIPGDRLPRAVAAFMFSSDGMQATHFSSRKIWPIYVMFGNESQLDRSSPEFNSLKLVGLIPHVSC